MKETMLTNILEEEKILKNIISNFETKNSLLIKELIKIELKNILILATGSSMNAALITKYFISDILNINIEIKEPFNYYNYEKINENIDLVIAISQSGKSTSTISALKYVKKCKNIPSIAITSNNMSIIAKESNMILDLGIGIEQVGFVTKGFSATVLNLFLLAIILAKEKKLISANQKEVYLKELNIIIENIPQVILKTENFIKEKKEIFLNAKRFIGIGYGACFGLIKEFETKFTETIRLPSQGFELEAYMHGPYLEANKEHIIFYFDNKGKLSERLFLLKNYMMPYIKQSFVIALDSGDINLNLNLNEHLATLLLIIPIQIMSYRIAEIKEIDLNIKIFEDFDKVLKSKI